MYEKLSTRVEGVVKLAHDIAREYHEECVGTQHVLLANYREGAGRAIGSTGPAGRPWYAPKELWDGSSQRATVETRESTE